MAQRLAVYTVGYLCGQPSAAKRLHEWLRQAILDDLATAPGFVRSAMPPGYNSPPPDLKVESGYLTYTLTVWEDLRSVYQFSYRSQMHRRALRELPEAYVRLRKGRAVLDVLWWFDEHPKWPRGDYDLVEEAARRMNHLLYEGPSPYAFDVKHPYDHTGRVADFRALRDRAT